MDTFDVILDALLIYDSQLVDTERRLSRLLRLCEKVESMPFSDDRTRNVHLLHNQIAYFSQQSDTLWHMRAAAIRTRRE